MQQKKFYLIIAAATLVVSGCSLSKGISNMLTKDLTVNLLLPDSEDGSRTTSTASEVIVDKKPEKGDILMNATTDEKGETVITDVIAPTTITAKFIHKPERFGQVDIEYIIRVPASFFSDDNYQTRLYPELKVMDDTLHLAALFLTGSRYREFQQSQYDKFGKFKKSIKTDRSAFARPKLLEKFKERNIPAGLEEKGNIFGLTLNDAEQHYVKRFLETGNEIKADDLDMVQDRMVTCPIITKNIIKDSLTKAGDTELYYRYLYKLKSRPGLKKVILMLRGEVYDREEEVYSFCSTDSLTFYISSISSLVRETGSTDAGYIEGIRQFKNMEYDKAAETLRPYKDYNAALALLAMDYNYAAYRILESLPKAGDVCYIKAIAYMRLGRDEKAVESYKEACSLDRAFVSRGNLDPEVSALKKKYEIDDMTL